MTQSKEPTARNRRSHTRHNRPRITEETFRNDPLYPRIERAVARILTHNKVVAPVNVLVHMGRLHPRDLDAWRNGQVPYLEKVIVGNLTRLGRLLRILRMHARELKLIPSDVIYRAPKSTERLRFSKTGDWGVERAYARHFIWPIRTPVAPSVTLCEEQATAANEEPAEVEESAEVAEATEVAEVTEVAEATEVAKATEVEESAEGTEATEVEESAEAAEATKVEEVAEATEVEESAEAAEATKVEEVAEATEVEESAKATEIEEATEVEEAAETEELERTEATEVEELETAKAQDEGTELENNIP